MALNIVSSNCVGGRMYQLLDEKYANPFIWSCINPTDFIYVLKNHEKINFKKIKIEDREGIFHILVDEKLDIRYTHHKEGNFEKPTKKSEGVQTNIYVRGMKEYLKDLYVKRCARMNWENTIYVVSDKINTVENGSYNYSHTDIKNVYDVPVLKVIATSIDGFENNKYNIIVKTDKKDSTANIAKKIIAELKRRKKWL